jgi:hypothetical protein
VEGAPKLVMADPKKTGVISPRPTAAMSISGVSSLSISTSSMSASYSSVSPMSSASSGSSSVWMR